MNVPTELSFVLKINENQEKIVQGRRLLFLLMRQIMKGT